MDWHTPWRVIKTLVFLLLLVFIMVLVLKNQQTVEVRFFLDRMFTVPLYGLMFLAMVFGLLLGMSIGGYSVFTLMRAQQKKIKAKWDNELKKQHGGATATPVSEEKEIVVVPAP